MITLDQSLVPGVAIAKTLSENTFLPVFQAGFGLF